VFGKPRYKRARETEKEGESEREREGGDVRDERERERERKNFTRGNGQVLRMRAEEERKKDKKRVFREAKAETRGRLDKNENGLRRFENVAAGFLISEELLQTPIGQLSEGQKGLLVLARLVRAHLTLSRNVAWSGRVLPS
jgi:hypothetical protein